MTNLSPNDTYFDNNLMKRKTSKKVYSTKQGDLRSEEARRLPKVKSLPPQQQIAEIRREKKGRGGKDVTVIRGLQLTPQDLKMLGKLLKKKCGSGGTIKEGTIEIQGDHREQVAMLLQKQGYKTKFTGG